MTKFVAGYLKGCEAVVDFRKAHEAGQKNAAYDKLLQMTVNIFTPEVIPNKDEAHGLILDCTFVGYPGNVTFFTQENNLHGFEAFQKAALDLAVDRGYAKDRYALFPSGLDYQSDGFLKYLTKTKIEQTGRFLPEAVTKEIELLSQGGGLDERTILSFDISFKPNQTEFNAAQYTAEYLRVIETADKFGNAVIAVRGHADPTKTLLELVRAGLKKGVLRVQNVGGQRRYSLNGKPLKLTNTAEIEKAITSGAFDGVAKHNPRETMQAALNLSRKRAEAVHDSLIKFAGAKGIRIDITQITPSGVGIREPFIAKPTKMAEALQNMRVEFRILRVKAEVAKPSDFDF